MRVDTGVGDGDALTGLEPEPAVVEAVEQADSEASAEVMNLLHQGVPLALLADLASPDGPASPSILEDEGLPDVAWWASEADDGAPTDTTDDAAVDPVAEEVGTEDD